MPILNKHWRNHIIPILNKLRSNHIMPILNKHWSNHITTILNKLKQSQSAYAKKSFEEITLQLHTHQTLK